MVRTSDARWRQLFDSADVVSEGGARSEADGRVWYGSTSFILTSTPDEAGLFAALAGRDIHLRLRALRAAHREASLRAPCRLGRVLCEIRVTTDPRGVRIDVDVQAPLIEPAAGTPRAQRLTHRT